ncbi:MAG: signal peptidase II [Clostridiales bacterium]|jgi:signal peptidase II|nr:signal peptidase II [Clostridiales bacterium]
MLAYFLIFGVVVFDQLTKLLIRLYMEVGDSVPLIPGVINLTYIENDGAAFGMLDNARWVFMLVSAIAIVAIILFLRKHHIRHKLLTISLSFIAGGGIGNMIDRIFLTEVTDFFETQFVDFAVFNVADSFITIGAILLGVYVIFFEPKVEKLIKQKEAEAKADGENNESENTLKDNGKNENNCTDIQ